MVLFLIPVSSHNTCSSSLSGIVLPKIPSRLIPFHLHLCWNTSSLPRPHRWIVLHLRCLMYFNTPYHFSLSCYFFFALIFTKTMKFAYYPIHDWDYNLHGVRDFSYYYISMAKEGDSCTAGTNKYFLNKKFFVCIKWNKFLMHKYIKIQTIVYLNFFLHEIINHSR